MASRKLHLKSLAALMDENDNPTITCVEGRTGEVAQKSDAIVLTDKGGRHHWIIAVMSRGRVCPRGINQTLKTL